MAEFRLYCVSRGKASRVLRVMLEKTFARGERSLVRLSSARREEELDMFLWMDPAAGFLPHGRVGKMRGSEEDFTAEQPILLTTTAAMATSGVVNNGARVLFHWQEGGKEEEKKEGGGDIDIGVDGGRFDLCCFLYEEGDGGAGIVAEALWGRLCGIGGTGDTEEVGKVGFWYEDVRGGWRKRQEQEQGGTEQKKEREKMVEEPAVQKQAVQKKEREEPAVQKKAREEQAAQEEQTAQTEERENIVGIGEPEASQESLF